MVGSGSAVKLKQDPDPDLIIPDLKHGVKDTVLSSEIDEAEIRFIR
jgi:hypothetical protein